MQLGIDEGYDLMPMNMVSFNMMEEEDEIIPKVKRAPDSIDYSGSYDKEIVCKGQKRTLQESIKDP